MWRTIYRMANADETFDPDPVAAGMYQLRSADSENPDSQAADLDAEELEQIDRLMRALSGLRDAERGILEASEQYMKLSSQDMRALHYLIAAKRLDQVVIPSMIAAHLHISAASTTKLLNRLERGGHAVRRMHPTDRRSFAIEITPETEALVRRTVGRQHAKRVNAAIRLTSQEREVVIRFLNEMTAEISLGKGGWGA